MHLSCVSPLTTMDVLIIERDKQMGSVLADTLDGEGISFAVASDEEALNLPSDDARG